MGLGNPTQLLPRFAPYPTGTPDELREMGENLAEVFSCAIPHVEGLKTIVRGCPRAGTCQRFFRSEKIGNFGPKDVRPESPGQGPENVPFSIETAEGDYMETFLPCHVFLGGPYGRMMAARNPEVNTGEKIRILGKAGEAKVMLSTTLPKIPGPKPSGQGDMTLVTTQEVIVVPKHRRPAELDPRWRMRQAQIAEELEDAVEDVLAASAGADMPVGAVEGQKATVESIPERKKSA